MSSKVTEIFLTPREQTSTFGLAVWHTMPRHMDLCHQHNDVEVNLMERGEMTYLLGGDMLQVSPGDLLLFWAGRPHQVITVSEDAFYWGFSVPLPWFLRWDLPESLVRPILGGTPVNPALDGVVADIQAAFPRWIQDLTVDSTETRRTMLLEMEVWMHRVAQQCAERRPDAQSGKPQPEGKMEKVALMARCITEHYMETLTVREVAQAVGLHENYAAQLFHRTTGATLVDFIAKQRLGHAQMLLATTNRKVLDVAMEAGFGSASRFYAVFRHHCDMTPNEYRAMLRTPATSPDGGKA